MIAVDNSDFAVAGNPWQSIGAEICAHSDFPHQTNVEFMRIVSPGEIEIRIFERGVGPTTSSGTGTSASATAAIAFHGCASPLARGVARRSADGELARDGQRTGTDRACNLDCARRGMVRMTAGSKPLMSPWPDWAECAASASSRLHRSRFRNGSTEAWNGFADSDTYHDSAQTRRRVDRCSLREHLRSGLPISTRHLRILTRASWRRCAAATVRTTCSRQWISNLSRTIRSRFFAYSDLTGLQLWLLDQLGLPAFHGPMVAADFYLDDGVHLESFQAALAGEPYSVGRAEGMRTLKAGTARGTLYGGCLSILVSLIGTPWEPATEDKLLFIEDVGAKPYQVDRMLWQLRQAGKLDGVRGIIFGEMLDCTSPGAPESLLEDAILSALDGIDVPIAIRTAQRPRLARRT